MKGYTNDEILTTSQLNSARHYLNFGTLIKSTSQRLMIIDDGSDYCSELGLDNCTQSRRGHEARVSLNFPTTSPESKQLIKSKTMTAREIRDEFLYREMTCKER